MEMTHLALYGSGRWGTAIVRTLHRMAVKVTVIKRGETPPSNIDGIVVATPISTHAEIALPFIERGVPVFIEKPVTGSLDEARLLFEAAEKANSLVHVGHIHLYNPAFVKAKKLVPTLGPIRYLYFEGLNNGPFRNDASVLWDWLPHPLSMALSLLTAKPRSVQAWGIQSLRPQSPALSDLGMVKFEFETGTTLLCTVNWLAPEKRTSLSIVGETSSLVFTDTALQKIALYEGMGPTVNGMNVHHLTPSITYPEYETTSPLECELTAFIQAIQQGGRERSELTLGVKIVSLIAAAEESIGKGGQIVFFKD